MHSKFEALLDWLGSRACLPVVVLENSRFPAIFGCTFHIGFVFFDWLLDDVDRILKLINVEEHGLDAEEAIEGDLVDNRVVLLNLFFEETADEL